MDSLAQVKCEASGECEMLPISGCSSPFSEAFFSIRFGLEGPSIQLSELVTPIAGEKFTLSILPDDVEGRRFWHLCPGHSYLIFGDKKQRATTFLPADVQAVHLDEETDVDEREGGVEYYPGWPGIDRDRFHISTYEIILTIRGRTSRLSVYRYLLQISATDIC